MSGRWHDCGRTAFLQDTLTPLGDGLMYGSAIHDNKRFNDTKFSVNLSEIGNRATFVSRCEMRV